MKNDILILLGHNPCPIVLLFNILAKKLTKNLFLCIFVSKFNKISFLLKNIYQVTFLIFHFISTSSITAFTCLQSSTVNSFLLFAEQVF